MPSPTTGSRYRPGPGNPAAPGGSAAGNWARAGQALAFAVLTALAGAAAFNVFHLPPTGGFTLAEGENWVALAVFVVTAVVASELAEAVGPAKDFEAAFVTFLHERGH